MYAHTSATPLAIVKRLSDLSVITQRSTLGTPFRICLGVFAESC
jgi:hypothetical protein